MSTQQTNKLRSTNVYGSFGNFDTSTGSILANGTFQRNVLVGEDLILGTERIDASGNAIDSNSNIKFTLNKVPYSIPLRILSYIQNVSSDIQAQINNISASSGNISSVGYITQTLSDTSSTQFGTNAFNKTLLSTTSLYNSAFGGNTLYNNSTGNFNTCLGHSSGFANSTGSCLTGVGQQALAKNTNANYNTAVGFLSSTDNTTGTGNTSIGSFSLLHNTIGDFNIAFGMFALSNNTTGFNNVSLGAYSGQSMTTATNSTCIGANSDAKFSSSTAIGYNSVCSATNQIMLGTSAETVAVPGNLSVTGTINSISSDIFSKIQYLSTVSSNVQSQINTVSSNLANLGNNPLVLYSTLNVSGFTTLTEAQVNTSLNVLQNINFLGSLNGITTNTFSFLSNLTGNIQNQINSISNTTPVGTVIQFAGSSASLNGYLPCDGNQYSASSYPNLFNVLGEMYGGDSNQGWFRVPNYQGVFLRGYGSQNLALVYGQPAKQYTSPPLGAYVVDKSVQPSNYVTSINQNVKPFLEKANSTIVGVSFTSSNAVASLQYTTANESGVIETFPVHTSVQYFIKY